MALNALNHGEKSTGEMAGAVSIVEGDDDVMDDGIHSFYFSF